MKRWFKTKLGFTQHEWLRFAYHQFMPDPHYPPPVLETLLYAPYSAVEKALYRQGKGSAEGLTLPHFLGIGGMQSGTTWLYENLRCHPRIYVPPVKELQYFTWRFHRSVRYYCRPFAPYAEKIRGEISTNYGGLPRERIQFIRSLLPEVRLLFMMRNPIDRAWSHAKQCLMFRTGKRYAEVREADFLRHFRSHASRTAGDYPTLLDTWLGVFPREQLYIGFFDDILRCPRRLLSDVLQHIGASTDEMDWAALSYNPTPESAWTGLPQDSRPGNENTDEDDSLQDALRWSDFHAAPLPAKYHAFLTEMYADQIEELYRRYGEPVAPWRCR